MPDQTPSEKPQAAQTIRHEPAKPEAGEVASGHDQVLRLQRVIGNAAVTALVGSGRLAPRVPPVVQRNWFDDVSKAASGAVASGAATASLTKLGLSNSADLPSVLAGWSDPDLAKWLTDLPDAVKGSQYCRALVALSLTRRQPLVDWLLRLGDFSWISNPADATLFYRFFDTVTATQADTLLARVAAAGALEKLATSTSAGQHTSSLRPWIARLPMGTALSDEQKTLVKKIFDGTKDSEVATLTACMNHRFDLVIGPSLSGTRQGETPVEWEAGGLRRMYPVLAALPINHVVKNKMLISMGRYQGTGAAGGYYEQFGKDSSMSYGATSLGAANSAANPGDPLYGVNRFDKVVRHEVGHAVDAEMGWSNGTEPANDKRGGWKSYGANYSTCVTDMVTVVDGPVNKLEATKRAEVIALMAQAMLNKTISGLAAKVADLDWVKALDAPTRAALLDDKVFAALKAAVNNPWYNETDGGPHLGDHVYEESYGGAWSRYRHDSRTRKVSLYQFRAPGEWFAEAYATYYEPDPKGNGTKLATRDADTKAYFDAHVHTRGASR